MWSKPIYDDATITSNYTSLWATEVMIQEKGNKEPYAEYSMAQQQIKRDMQIV